MRSRTRAILWLAGLSVFLSSVAQAQRITTIGKRVPDIKIKLFTPSGEEEKNYFESLEGAVVVFYFWRPSNALSVEKIDVFRPLTQKYAKKGVEFISITSASDEVFKEFQKTHDLSFFKETWWQAADLYYLLGAFSEPYVVIIGPKRHVLWRGVPGDDLEERIDDVIARTHPPLGDEAWLEKQLRRATQLLDQEEYGKAYTIAYRIYKITKDRHPLQGKAESLLAKLETAGQKWLKEAIAAEEDGDIEEAARIVAEIAVRYHDLKEEEKGKKQSGGGGGREGGEESVKRKAEQEIGRMMGDRKLKKAIREARKEAQARMLLEEGQQCEEDGDYVGAKHIYLRVAKKFDETEAADEAKDRLRRFKRDKEVRAKLTEQRHKEEAWRLLYIGDLYAGIEFFDQAENAYQRLVEEFGDTLAGQHARQRLEKLAKQRKRAKAG